MPEQLTPADLARAAAYLDGWLAGRQHPATDTATDTTLARLAAEAYVHGPNVSDATLSVLAATEPRPQVWLIYSGDLYATDADTAEVDAAFMPTRLVVGPRERAQAEADQMNLDHLRRYRAADRGDVVHVYPQPLPTVVELGPAEPAATASEPAAAACERVVQCVTDGVAIISCTQHGRLGKGPAGDVTKVWRLHRDSQPAEQLPEPTRQHIIDEAARIVRTTLAETREYYVYQNNLAAIGVLLGRLGAAAAPDLPPCSACGTTSADCLAEWCNTASACCDDCGATTTHGQGSPR